MTATRRVLWLLAFVVLALSYPLPSSAQLFPSACPANGECPDGFTCRGWFLGIERCLFEFCNADSDCSKRGARCTEGICRLPAGGGGGSAGGGHTVPGVGSRCGPQQLGGGVIKNIACRRGLRCVQGTCQQPLR